MDWLTIKSWVTSGFSPRFQERAVRLRYASSRLTCMETPTLLCSRMQASSSSFIAQWNVSNCIGTQPCPIRCLSHPSITMSFIIPDACDFLHVRSIPSTTKFARASLILRSPTFWWPYTSTKIVVKMATSTQPRVVNCS
jgi:hypothetical protein